MNTQRFRLKSTGQIVYSVRTSGKYSDVLLPFGRESNKGHRGTIMTVKNEKLIEEKSGGYTYG